MSSIQSLLDLGVGSLAYFVTLLTERYGVREKLRAKAKQAGLNWRTLQRITSGEVKLPMDVTLERIAKVLARNKEEERDIYTEARRMRDKNRRADKE